MAEIVRRVGTIEECLFSIKWTTICTSVATFRDLLFGDDRTVVAHLADDIQHMVCPCLWVTNKRQENQVYMFQPASGKNSMAEDIFLDGVEWL